LHPRCDGAAELIWRCRDCSLSFGICKLSISCTFVSNAGEPENRADSFKNGVVQGLLFSFSFRQVDLKFNGRTDAFSTAHIQLKIINCLIVLRAISWHSAWPYTINHVHFQRKGILKRQFSEAGSVKFLD